ncbi:tetratricopeptide (TPR) repeat protein [Paucibacter oligotrophus]|uniref:Tetratricopeptide (TPR) repeat protein n=1 Tax=Roseateles oligotrophus TaxID=1769250 RepID=A0A840L3S1_9BURK|nr:LA2681 family HEPN domain-containing protein [Roseateles oligotrophus]MBB4843164.1 tetratricopeptide (TPR) repeat protein [Roseateles oligotrophus]
MLDLESILALETLEDVEPTEALGAIALLVDYAMDTVDPEMTTRALGWADRLESRLTADTDLALLDYYRANAWANRHNEARQDCTRAWAWDQEPLQQQLLLLRRALNRVTFEDLPSHVQCQILTNLGNQLSFVGRFIEARELWSRAVTTLPKFWMARFNRGNGLMAYARCLYDDGHRCALALSAHTDMTDAITDLDSHPHYGDPRLRRNFVAVASQIAEHVDLASFAAGYDAEGSSLGDDAGEQAYRKWCLDHCLFLNPLNDTGPHSIAARDVMQLPTFATALDEKPVVLGLFNQLKQEFVSARWLYFEGITTQGMHFSDRDVALYNTLDYPALGLAAEKVKVTFRMSYSLFDKIAFFLNHYLKLGIPVTQVSFRHIWRDKKTGVLRPAFENTENLAFRGLYWLSKDFFDPDLKDTTEPEARACHDLRNHLEHKYLKLHLMMQPELASTSEPFDLFKDDLAHSLTVAELEQRTLRMLKLARSALIYLLLGMNQEERRRRAATAADDRMGSMPIYMADDIYKQRFV